MTVPGQAEHAKRIAGYEILSKLGQGGMGAVYKARQLSLDRTVALKVLPKQLTDDPDFIGRFSREARVTGQLNHPHIIKVFDVGRSPTGICYYSMEFVEGESLRAILEREKRLSPQRTLRILEEMAAALDHAQKHGVIHRDIKPDNILIDMEGHVKLADLGLAKIADESGPVARTKAAAAAGSFASLSGQVVGTPYYMSPEQAEGKAVDTRSDLYSLGATAYHLLAGAPPFTADTPLGVLTKHLTEPLVPLHARLPGVPEPLEQAVHRMMAKDPAARFQTPADLLAELARVRREMGNARTPAPAARPSAAPARRRLVMGLALGAAAVAVLAILPSLRARRAPAPVPAPAPAPPAKDLQQEAQGQLDRIRDYRRGHPDDYASCIERLRTLVRDYPSTKAAGEARGEMADLEVMQARHQRAQKALADLRGTVEPLLREGRFAEAEEALARMPPSEETSAAVRELEGRLRQARDRASRRPLPASPPAAETSRPPAPATDPSLEEARLLLASAHVDDDTLRRIGQLLAKPPADPQVAAEYNRAFEQARCHHALDGVDALRQAHDWEGAERGIEALRKAFPSLTDGGDPRLRRWLEGMERHVRKNLACGAWRCSFERGRADTESWQAAGPRIERSEPERRPTGSLTLLDAEAADRGAETPAKGRYALRVGARRLGEDGGSVEAQSPLFDIHPGAVLSLSCRLYLQRKASSRSRIRHDDAVYLCLKGVRGDLLPFRHGGFRRRLDAPGWKRVGLLGFRGIGDDDNWDTDRPSPKELVQMNFHLDGATLDPLKDGGTTRARLCAGISMEDARGYSAVLVLDSIEVFYEEPEQEDSP